MYINKTIRALVGFLSCFTPNIEKAKAAIIPIKKPAIKGNATTASSVERIAKPILNNASPCDLKVEINTLLFSYPFE